MSPSPARVEEDRKMSPRKRICDYCSEATALLYCRADSAKLCLLCDREIHSANQLFSKHTRLPLCDACDASPASVFCSTESSVLCQNCDWERHRLSLPPVHERRPLEGFTGCPSVSELQAIVGLEEVGQKALFLNEDSGGGGDGSDGFSDLLVWDAPCVGSLDDLIGSTNLAHDFHAMGVPSLPKNRNAACGQYKEEILGQLRHLTKLEPNLNFENVDVEPLSSFQSLGPQRSVHPEHMSTGFADGAEPAFPAFGRNEIQCCTDLDKAANQLCFPISLKKRYLEENPEVPDKKSGICGNVSHANDCTEALSYPTRYVALSALPRAASHELNSQERDSAISRYKEKKKTRRYDKHIRYESRKARADSRIRIKGRFAKMHQ